MITVGGERGVSTELNLLSYMHMNMNIQYNMHIYMYSYGGRVNGHPSAIICLSSLDVTLGIVNLCKNKTARRICQSLSLGRHCHH